MSRNFGRNWRRFDEERDVESRGHGNRNPDYYGQRTPNGEDFRRDLHSNDYEQHSMRSYGTNLHLK